MKPEVFEISPEQLVKIYDWMGMRKYQSRSVDGARFTYCFTPTSIGTVIKVIDEVTGDEFDASDYENW